jgi:F0F1-type ATP synthase delta subunit
MKKKYSRAKLVDYIINSLDKGENLTSLAREVAAYLISVGRSSDLGSIMRDAQEARAENNGVVELTVRSAHQLNNNQLDNVEGVAKLQYSKVKKVIAHPEHDDSIIGGANILLPHSSLDVTVRGKLNQLRENISKV